MLATAASGMTGLPLFINYNGISGTVSVDTASSPKRLLLTVTGSPYDAWAAFYAPGSEPDEDFDGDGVINLVEFVLGGDKDTDDLDKLPTVVVSGGHMTFTFVRDQESTTADVTTVIEVGTDLATWPHRFSVDADSASSTNGVIVTDNLDGTDTITLTLPQFLDQKKFARLRVSRQ